MTEPLTRDRKTSRISQKSWAGWEHQPANDVSTQPGSATPARLGEDIPHRPIGYDFGAGYAADVRTSEAALYRSFDTRSHADPRGVGFSDHGAAETYALKQQLEYIVQPVPTAIRPALCKAINNRDGEERTT
ncbi:hypothetical protein DBIPINDM_008099 (plasmid) [Mesorhizobium sp. AR02]|uniref:hypothetical protein n=1 Tax=Mesorhizobium sp. AR02 TaxID=2865837 RepID=UPI00215F8492|nr:hypothetical protein [Mesorhizobium sp. AR02]UVK57515.1 hypothetical protein DBIPINDM_008099 [Mesorhizobium sp. AR02]